MPAEISPSPTTAPLSSSAADTPTWRDAFVDASAFSAIVVVASNEILSSFNALTTTGVLAAWGLVAIALIGWFVREGTRPALVARAHVPRLSRNEKYFVAFYAFICLVTLYVALAGTPNASDSHSYHLPRVLRWIQDGTLAFYPAHNLRQLWIGPGWEYFQVQLQLITGTDALANVVQWLAMVASPVVVSLVARELGAKRDGQLLAALFALTIPMGIAQGSGSQVDLFAGFWLLVSLALLLRIRRLGIEGTSPGTAVLFGAAVGMAVLSKATNVLFFLPFAVWIAPPLLKQRLVRALGFAAIAVVVATAFNAGHMLRNKSAFGSVLGVPGAYGIANEKFGPLALASNIVRNAAMHLGTPSDAVNATLTRAVTRMHALVGLDVNDPSTTYAARKFEVPAEWDDEGQGSNQLHFLIIIAAGIWLTLKKRSSPATRYMWCVFASALLFCLYLKWQPWHSRLHLPLFMIAGAAVGVALESRLSNRWMKVIAAALALTAIYPSFRNNMRPILVRRPLFTVSYDELLFSGGHPEWKTYAAAADFVAASGCSRIGLIETHVTWEYPVWKLVERRTGKRPELRQVSVTNISQLTASDRDRAFKPCMIMNIQSLVPRLREFPDILQLYPAGVPRIPRGFAPVWNRDFITIYLPADA